jgi:hypothetical protein
MDSGTPVMLNLGIIVRSGSSDISLCVLAHLEFGDMSKS